MDTDKVKFKLVQSDDSFSGNDDSAAVRVAEEAKQLGEDNLLKEYYQVFQTVNEFDKQLLTIKGWGVTLSLAALALGIQYAHYGLFLVAALSGLAFWLNEGVMKRYQMRYYLRMREIEVLQYKHASSEDARARSSPRIDSSWSHAGWLYSGKDRAFSYPPKQIEGPRTSYRLAWFFPQVCLPHVVSVVAGLTLLCLGIYGALGDNMRW